MLNTSMSLQEVYKYCRPWAIAKEAEGRPGDSKLTPIAPYAVDNAGEMWGPADATTGNRSWKLTSTCRASYNKGWSPEYGAALKVVPVAGGGASDREPHNSLEAKRCIQHNQCHGGRTDYKEEMSLYQEATDRKALAREHRRNEAARQLPHNMREARWYRCFRQWEGQWGTEDASTRVTGTEFSVLPAGYIPKSGQVPAEAFSSKQRHVDKYGPSKEAEQGNSPNAKAAKAAPKPAAREEQRLPKAWQKTLAEGPGDNAGKDSKPAGARQRGFGAWTKAARQRKLKGAEYMKAPIPGWLKEMPAKLKQADLLAALKSSDKGDVKYFNNQMTVPNEEIYT